MKYLTTANKITAYITQCIKIFDFDTGVKTIGEFVKQVDQLAKQLPINQHNSFKGDMFEVFGEIFFNIHSADTTVGLTDYHSVPLSEDYGVDGIGTNVNGDLCAIQMKYKSDPLEVVKLEDIAKTYSAGRLRHNIPLENNDTIFVFTTGNEITSPCQVVFGRLVRVIDRKIIAGKVDNNQTFWGEAQDLILNTLDSLQ